MKIRPYRCHNPACADDPAGRPLHDFWAEKPTCDKCDKDKKVEELVILHFDAGDNRVACDRNGPWRCANKEVMTGAPVAVTCPLCRDTEAWKKADEERGSGVGGIDTESPAWKAYKNRALKI